MTGTTSRQGSLLAFGAVLLVVGAIACGNDGAGDADQALAPELAQRNGGPVYFMNVAGVLVGDRSTWEQVGIVRYASAHAMVDMILDPDFQAGAVHKFATLEATEALYTRGDLFPLP